MLYKGYVRSCIFYIHKYESVSHGINFAKMYVSIRDLWYFILIILLPFVLSMYW